MASSGRSDRRGLTFTALPASGYDGEAPEWPLPERTAWLAFVEDGVKCRERDGEATRLIARREAELWAWAWRTPQAWAWAQPSEAWRLYTIAMWVRTYVLCESSDATAADKGALHRFADQIGLTPAGLKENGWQVARDELAAKVAERPVAPAVEDEVTARRRRAISGGA